MAKHDPSEFFDRKKPTNADRIRAMSDEELAEWIYQETTNAFNLLLLGNSKPTKSFFTWLDWLRKEVEG